MTSQTMKSPTNCLYWALCAETGQLFNLGDHGDYEAANLTAENLHIDAVWLIDEEGAMQWKKALSVLSV